MNDILNRWLRTAKPGSWRDRAVYFYIYTLVCKERTKLALARLFLPERLYWRYLLGK
jgi:hypothetical protein